MCLSQILAPWPLPSPSACNPVTDTCPCCVRSAPRSAYSVPIWSLCLDLCLSLHRDLSASAHGPRAHVPLPSKSPPCLSKARMPPKLLDVATQAPLAPACPHLCPAPGNLALKLALRDSLWLAPGPSHMIFPEPETLFSLPSLFDELYPSRTPPLGSLSGCLRPGWGPPAPGVFSAARSLCQFSALSSGPGGRAQHTASVS